MPMISPITVTSPRPEYRIRLMRSGFPAPVFWLNPEVRDFYRFTPEDVRLDCYETHPQIKNIPVAV